MVTVKEEFILCKLLTTTTSEESVQNFEECLCQFWVQWTKLISMCTDGAPLLMSILSGCRICVKQIACRATFTYCVLHRYALAVKTLLPNLGEVF
jgi:hypothetical protein